MREGTKVRVLAGRDTNRHVLDTRLITESGDLYLVTAYGIDYSQRIGITNDRTMIRGWPGMQRAHAVRLDNGWDIPVRALRRIMAAK